MTREEKLEAVEEYLLNNIGELAEILEELEEECRSKFGFTVHANTAEFFNAAFKDDAYSAVLLTNSGDYDVEDEFLICYDHQTDIESFSRSYPPVEFDTNLSDIANMIVKACEHSHVLMMSNELFRLVHGI